MALTEKENKRAEELLKKIGNGGLTASELKELQGYFSKAIKGDKGEEAKEKDKSNYSSLDDFRNATDKALDKAMVNLKEKLETKVQFNKLSSKQKAEIMKKQIDELSNSEAFKQLKKQQTKKQEEKDFEAFYAEHARKYGNDLDLVVNDSQFETTYEYSEDDERFYEEYLKSNGFDKTV